MAAIYGLNTVLTTFNAATLAPVPLTITQSFFISLLFAVLFAGVLRTPWGSGGDTNPQQSAIWPFWLKGPLWLVVVAIVSATLLGYISLAGFLTNQTVITGLVLITVWLLHRAIDEFATDFVTHGRTGARVLTDTLGATPIQSRIFALALGLALNLALLALAVPFLLLQWGFSFEEIKGWTKALFFGFQVGSFHISLARILIAIALFVAVLFLIRLLQRQLDEHVLVPPRFEPGLAHSIRTGIGYIGFALAIVAAISYVGLDFTNLAIVAGALSVGIGFGLQSIVNNFVSGLILLVERPVEVGDWVRVGDAEGYVKRISVRSTEIETFDRSSIIVPNSEFIAGRVTNWTHRNKMGRVVITVGVSYDSDPNQVVDILTAIGRDHRLALAWPQPSVSFNDFGASSLDFSLRVFIADVNDIITVGTELRIAIHEAFRDAGIEIPFPQTDVHMRDLDGLKDALARARAERGEWPVQENEAPKAATGPAKGPHPEGDDE